jgi:hypothetical protein
MNMISTGAFLAETDASTKQNELVKKLTAAWEKKNSKTARAGGASLMALSLAACGGEDNTPFSAADVSAAEAAATTAALTGADGTVYASVDAAVTSNDTAIADAARAEGVASVDITTDNQAAIDAAVAAVDLTTDNAAATDAAVAADTAFASLADLVAAYDALANPAGSTAALTTSTDILIGTSSNDSFTGTTATYAAGDVVSDGSTTDNDTLTMTVTDDINLTGSIVNIENVNINLVQFTNTDFDVDVGGISDGTTISFDVTQTGSTVTALSVDSIGSVTLALSDDFTTLDMDTDADADVTVTSAYTGTGTLVISDSGTVTMDTLTVTTADDVTFNLTNTNVDETLTVTSANDILITAVDAADTLVLTSGDETIITTADDAETITISAQGTALSATGAASTATTASAINGATDLDVLNLSGNGGDLRIDIAGGATSDALSTINVTGDYNVTVIADAGDHDVLANKLTFNDNSSATTKLVLDTKTDDTTLDARAIGADEIELDADFGAETITVASGQHYIASNDQATGLVFTSALASASTNTITFEVSDEITTTTGSTATTYDIDDITFTNFATVNLIATDNFANQTTAAAVANLTAGPATLNISGSGTFSNITGGVITAGSIDASAMTGAASIFLSGAVAGVSTGSGADTLTLEGAKAYDLDTGAGNDTIAFGTTVTSATIDGGAGTDTVSFTATTNLQGGSKNLTLSNIEIIDIDASGDAASTLTINSSNLTGQTLTVISTENTTGDILTVIGNGSTIDLSGITVETADITTNIDATTWTGVSAVTITGTNDADDIDIDGGVGSTASGGAGDDNIAGGAGADTINGDGGADTITGGGGADTITGGGGGDTITSGDGADTIDLTEAVAATDTLITSGGAAGTAMSHDTVTGFAAGSASTADEVDIDISNIEALATNLSDLDDATSDTGAGNATASTVTEAFDAANLTSGTDLLIIGGGLTFSSVAAVADALEDGGSVEMTVNGADTAGDVYMVLYSDGTNSHLAAIETSVAAGDNGTYADGELSGNMVMTFNGISDATDFAATNFDFIA